MSQILLGLIGVIIFIGLALAASVLFGDQFRSASTNSRASSVTQAASQIANAASLSNLQQGTALLAAADLSTTLVANNFLQAVPANPVSGGSAFTVRQRSNAATTNNTGTADVVLASIGTGNDSSTAGSICRQIENQMGNTNAIPSAATTDISSATPRASGCFRTSAAVAGAGWANQENIVYTRF